MKFLETYKAYVVIFLLICAIAYFIYQKGKKSGDNYIVQAKYPQGGKAIPAGWDPNPLAVQLFDAMDGFFTMSGTKNEAFKALLDMPTNEMVIAVYNAFNQKYANKGKGTLTQWIKDEYYVDFILGHKAALLNRLKSLNLQ